MRNRTTRKLRKGGADHEGTPLVPRRDAGSGARGSGSVPAELTKPTHRGDKVTYRPGGGFWRVKA